MRGASYTKSIVGVTEQPCWVKISIVFAMLQRLIALHSTDCWIQQYRSLTPELCESRYQ